MRFLAFIEELEQAKPVCKWQMPHSQPNECIVPCPGCTIKFIIRLNDPSLLLKVTD